MGFGDSLHHGKTGPEYTCRAAETAEDAFRFAGEMPRPESVTAMTAAPVPVHL